MGDLIATLTRSRVETMVTERFVETQNAMQTHFEEPQESHNLNLAASMEDFDATLAHSRLESMIKHFVETQTVQNKEIRNQSL